MREDESINSNKGLHWAVHIRWTKNQAPKVSVNFCERQKRGGKVQNLNKGLYQPSLWVPGRSSPTATQHWEARIEPAKMRISSFANLHFCFAGSLCLRVTCANCETLFPTTDGALFSKVVTYNLNQSSVSENFFARGYFCQQYLCPLYIWSKNQWSSFSKTWKLNQIYHKTPPNKFSKGYSLSTISVSFEYMIQ